MRSVQDTCADSSAAATSIAKDLGDEWGLAYALSTQAYFGDDLETKLANAEASIERFHALGDEYYELTMMTNASHPCLREK